MLGDDVVEPLADVDDLVAEINALVADVDAGTGDQLFDLTLRLAAEAAEELLIRV